MSLQRLVLSYNPEGVEIRALYHTKASPGPNTKVRQREVAELVRTGLRDALEAIESRVDVVGTSGFEVREDIIRADAAKAPLKSGTS
jgi:hypothetical protein